MNVDHLRLDSIVPTPSGSAGRVASRPIALDEVIARRVPVQWDEAVAVIEALCELVVSAGTDAVPALQDVLIGADGVVTVSYVGRGERGPAQAGRALHTLLSTADVPVALRLFVTQATATETHASIREFAQALSYFCKPNRKALVQALHDRCMAGPGVVGALDTPPLPRVHNEQAPKTADAQSSARQRRRWIVRVGVAACLLGVGVWLWVSGVANDTGGALLSGLRSRTEGVMAALSPSPASETQVVVAESPAEPTPAPRPRTAANRTSVTIPAASATPEASPSSVVPDTPAPTEPPIPDAPPPAPLAVVDVPATPVAAQAIYSSNDLDVSPPVFRTPSWTSPLTVGANTERVDRMEILVSATGTVERVRLVSGPTRMPDMMLLSAAKSWRFRPALKDGEPVRYLTTASWTGFP